MADSVAHDAGNLIIRVCRVRMFQVVEHGDGATVDGLHCGIGVTQLLHGEEPLAVYQLIASRHRSFSPSFLSQTTSSSSSGETRSMALPT